MKFTSSGLSWADNIYQKLEDIYTDNDMVQISCKYVEAVGKNFRKIFDEDVSDKLIPSDPCDDKPVSNFSLEHTDEDSKDSRLGLDENASNEKLSACVMMHSILSSEEDPSMTLLYVGHDSSQQNICDEHNKESISTEATGSNGCDDEPVLILSLENNVEDSKESRVMLDENVLHEKLLACVKLESNVSSEEDISMASFGVDQDLNQENTCDDHNKKSIPTEATGSHFSDGVGENYVNVPNLVASLALTRALPSANEVCPSEFHQNELLEGGSLLSGFTASIDIHDDAMEGSCTLKETMSLLSSPEKEHEHQTEPNKSETSIEQLKIEISDDCVGDVVSNSPDVVHANTEQMEVFEDVELEDFSDDIEDYDIEDYELDLISHRASKKMSNKKKLIHALISNLRSMNRNRVESYYHGIAAGTQVRQRIDASSISSTDLYLKKSSAPHFCESEWEVL